MKNLRQGLWVVLIFMGGAVVGIAAVFAFQTLFLPQPLAASHLQATIYLPLQDNNGQRFSEDRWNEAIGLLVSRHGGATLGSEYEGWWARDNGSRVYREPIREVLVSLPRDQRNLLEQTVRDVGKILGQEAMYFRLEEVHIKLVETE